MRWELAAGIGAVAALSAAEAQTPVRLGPPAGGTASYRIGAVTTSGLGAMMGRGGGMSAMMGAMMGGGAGGGGAIRSLDLELGSNAPARGAPTGEHQIPAGMNMGASLPLVTPRAGAGGPVPDAPGRPADAGKPSGRMLLFWGCGSKARPGQPVVIDFAKLAGAAQSGQTAAILRMSRAMEGMGRGMSGAMGGTGGFARGKFATVGVWPNERARTNVPARASLVGDHLVRSSYAPDIRFTMAPGQDFLDTFRFTRNARDPDGSVGLAWQPIGGALAYGAMAFGGGRDQIVVWTSSELQTESSASEFASADEIARLVEQRILLSPQTTRCAVPAEAARAMREGGMLTMTGYGPTHSFSFPSRPPKALASWAPDWTTKVGTKSTHMGLLGEEMPEMEDGDSSTTDRDARPSPRRKRGVLEGLGLPF